jgi:hypothetical protein
MFSSGFSDERDSPIAQLDCRGLVALLETITAVEPATGVIKNFTFQTGYQRHKLCRRITDIQRPEVTRDVIGDLAPHLAEDRFDVSFIDEFNDIFMDTS